MCVDHHCDARALSDDLRNNGNAGRAAHEQYPADIARIDPSGVDRSFQRLGGLGDPRSDHELELVASEPHLRLNAGDGDRDRRVGVGGERLLGSAALVAEPRLAGTDLRVGGVGSRYESV